MSDVQVLSYGGGVQTVAMCVLVRSGRLPRPDHIVSADTGREIGSTWEYLDAHIRPLLAEIGLSVDVAPHSLATVDLYGKNGDLLIPAFTATGKLPTFCSTEWKARVVERHLRNIGVASADQWIGFTTEERRRARPPATGPWRRIYPLLALMLTRSDCEDIIADAGLPVPRKSSCFMCPHRSNAEWREVRDHHPEQWVEAVRLDDDIRAADEFGALYLHRSLLPLPLADLDGPEKTAAAERQCGLGTCFL